jgi:hypothetical protein
LEQGGNLRGGAGIAQSAEQLCYLAWTGEIGVGGSLCVCPLVVWVQAVHDPDQFSSRRGIGAGSVLSELGCDS